MDITFRHAIYAHSDWFEILYDHGLLGIFIFSGMYISLFLIRKKVNRNIPHLYLPFLALIFAMFLKSVVSGTYMTKFDAVSYGIIGFYLGKLTFIKKSNRLT
jgi:hypothetical protein